MASISSFSTASWCLALSFSRRAAIAWATSSLSIWDVRSTLTITSSPSSRKLARWSSTRISPAVYVLISSLLMSVPSTTVMLSRYVATCSRALRLAASVARRKASSRVSRSPIRYSPCDETTRTSANAGGSKHHSMEQQRQPVRAGSRRPVTDGLDAVIKLQGRSGMDVTPKRLTHPYVWRKPITCRRQHNIRRRRFASGLKRPLRGLP